MSSELPELLCRPGGTFPMYQVSMVTPRHIIFAGGGGAAKTGAFNGFEIFEISHNGEHCVAESVKRYSTGDYAVMSFHASNHSPSLQQTYLASGHDEKCQIYTCKLIREFITPPDEPNGAVRQRNGGAARSGPSQTRLTFSIDPVKAVQTDFTAEDPYQKVVKISPNGKFAATGGEDGIIRIWTFPEFNRVHEIENSHDKEIDDLDFSPDSTKVVSVSKDGTARVWDVAKGRRHAEMGWDSPGKLKFMYKRVRYGRIEGDDRKYKAYTISNPIGSRNPTAYLIRWNPKSYTLEQAAPFEGVLSALAVSDNGNFVATGSMTDGIVNIYTAFNLQRLKRVVKAHDSFITGLQFLPCGPEADAIRGFSDCSVVSISVDNKVCIHHIPRMKTISMFWAAVVIVFFLISTFILCSYLGL